MPKFFVKSNQVDNNFINIIGEDIYHIKNVLRLKEDDELQVCNLDNKKNYVCKIEKIEDDKIKCKIVKEVIKINEPNTQITIFQGLPKADKMELIIQKSIELGAKEIIPVEMERCVVKIDNKSKEKKLDRWQKIAEVAAKQCGRDIVPEVKDIVNLKKLCNFIQNYDIVLVAYENERNNTLKSQLIKVKNKKNLKIGIIIGPEGGIEIKELEMLKDAGAIVVTLGERILRTETVALSVTSNIIYELEG